MSGRTGKRALRKRAKTSKRKGDQRVFAGFRSVFGREGGKKAPRFFRWKDWLPSDGLSPARAGFAVAMAVSLLLFGAALFRSGGIFDVLHLAKRVEAMRAELEVLAKENVRLGEENRRLRDDPEEIERVARDMLGLVRPGERVYEFIGRD
ncbi:MAG: septum formation initiator family protein [Nitrospinota bacterium]|nr:septum formation initiator family protein [Nitrospinota bacterium]MDP6484032.1 septum formation initiator family protein [Nitrospinota bacterium]